MKKKRDHLAYTAVLNSGKKALSVSSSIKLPYKKHVAASAIGITGRDAASRTTWIDVAPIGEWAGHKDGPFILDQATFDSVIKYFKKTKSSPQVDYGHGSLFEQDGQPKPAAGYILDLRVENDVLWAKVEFTKRAAAYIRNGEYRFCSGVFCWDITEPESGDSVYAILDSIALTNRPFIDGQNPIMLSLNPNSKRKILTMITKEKILEGLKASLDEEVTMEKAVEELKKLMEPEVKEETKTEETKTEEKKEEIAAADLPIEEVVAEEGDGADPLLAMAEAMGLDVPTLLEKLMANLDAVKAIISEEVTEDHMEEPKSEEMPLSTVAALSQVRALTNENSKLRAQVVQAKGAESEEEVEKLISEGKILPGAKDSMVALAKADMKSFRALSKHLTVIVPLGKDAPNPNQNGITVGTAADEVPTSHPSYVALSNYYKDPKNGWGNITKDPTVLDRVVRDALKRKQSFGA